MTTRATKPRTYAAQISGAQLMAAALKANLSALKSRGMTAKFVSSLEATLSKAADKNSEQEKLKADLKAATAALDTLMKQMGDGMKEATKVVKLAMPKEQWKEFGISATR